MRITRCFVRITTDLSNLVVLLLRRPPPGIGHKAQLPNGIEAGDDRRSLKTNKFSRPGCPLFFARGIVTERRRRPSPIFSRGAAS